MISKAVFFLLIALCLRVSSKNCTTSTLKGIASGLTTITIFKNISENYAVPLSGFNLGTNVSTFTVGAIAGFSAPSSQKFYSIVISTNLNNDNTQMNFTISSFYSDNQTQIVTVWNRVKISWLAASTLFQTVVSGDSLGGSYIWAGSAQAFAPFTETSGPIFDNSTFVAQTAEMSSSPSCGFINNGTGYFDLYCSGHQNSRFLTHSYIMGFQFEPSSNYTVAASALQGEGGNTTLADRDEALAATGFTFADETGGESGTQVLLTGPKVLVKGFEGQLKYIKIAFVITVILDISIFPINNSSSFEYSGVYMSYSQMNKPQAIRLAFAVFSERVDGSQNYNYYSLMTAQYQIFGLSSFTIAPSLNSTIVNFDIFFDSLDSVILQTANSNQFSDVNIARDSWNSITNKCYPQSKIINSTSLQSTTLTTVPPMNDTEQHIAPVAQTGTYTSFMYSYSAAPIGDTPVAASQFVSALSSTVKYTNNLLFKDMPVGWTTKLELTITNFNDNSQGYTADVQVSYELLVEGVQVLTATKTPSQSGAENDIWTQSTTVVLKSSTPTVVLNLNAPRDATNKLVFQSALSIASEQVITYNCAFGLSYNVETKVCEGCPTGCAAGCNQYICSSCTEGYFYLFSSDSLVRCNKCPSTCLTCTSTTNCNTCQTGYKLQNSLCVSIATPGSTQSESGPSLAVVISIIIAVLAIIAIIVIIIWKRKKDSTPKQETPIDTVGSRGTMDHVTKVQWTKVNEQIFKLDTDCASCRTVPGNSILPCGHNYHLSCLGQWFRSNLQCNKCRRSVSGDVTVVCIRCKQFYFKKSLGQTINLYEEQFEICDQCYRQKLKGSIKRHLQIQLIPQEIIIDE